jgi:hypothetical protein
MPRKPRVARYWVTGHDLVGHGDKPQEVGPFIEEADARLCRAALALFASDWQWTMSDKTPSY